ncbi:MAG: anaerobic ribonucleoside-triphosphate reductase activating protein [Oscillospiraceae bacterium]|nr:anaerobic ribonucleoside-triphosphate reductase activating protein [Oscillospiraceae bacterium]
MSDDLSLRVAAVTQDSAVDGPGLRLAVFTQGCPRSCPGCHNPKTQDPGGGYDTTAGAVLREVRRNPLLAGVTFSGGEPFLQPSPLAAIARAVKARGLTVWVYSGFLFEELLDLPGARELLEVCDVLVDGPFEQSKKSYDLLWRGSANQRLIDLPASLRTGKAVELAIQTL